MAANADSLLAFLVVAKSSRGASVVYAYPPAPVAVPRTSVPIYPSVRSLYHQSGDSTPSDSTSDDSSESDLGEDQADFKPADADQFLGFSGNVLASLLSPSRELCDQPFELVVDHLGFVGHPVWLGDDEPSRRPETTREEDEADMGDDEEQEEDSRGRTRQRAASLADMTPTNELSQLSLEPKPVDRTTATSNPPSRGLSPTPPIELRRSSVSNTTVTRLSSFTSSQQSQSSFDGASRLISFNFVCVIDTPPDSHLSSHLEGYYKDVIIPVTANLKALEREDRWLGRESTKLRRAREKAVEKGLNLLECADTLISTSSLASALRNLFSSLKARQLANIAIGKLPVQVLFRGEVPVEEERDTSLERNNGDYVARSASDDEDDGIERARSASPSREVYQKQRPPPLFSRMRRRPAVRFHPWETLLPLEDPEDLKASVDEGSLLWQFLDICSPTLSFAEYETLLDLDTNDNPLRDVVEHLVHWRKARVVDVVSLKGSYAVSASFDPRNLPSLTQTFRSQFPRLPALPALLAQLSPTEAFSALCSSNPSHRAVFFHALVWLLQHEVVEKQRTYVRLFASEEIKRGAIMKWANSGTNLHAEMSSSAGGRSISDRSRNSSRADLDDTRSMSIVGSALSGSPPPGTMLSRSQRSEGMSAKLSGRARRSQTDILKSMSGCSSNGTSERLLEEQNEKVPSVILEPGRPSTLERRWLDEICRDKDRSVVERFDKMVRMLNGGHHLDEIRHRAQLSRKDVRLVLAAFAEHIIMFTHP